MTISDVTHEYLSPPDALEDAVAHMALVEASNAMEPLKEKDVSWKVQTLALLRAFAAVRKVVQAADQEWRAENASKGRKCVGLSVNEQHIVATALMFNDGSFEGVHPYSAAGMQVLGFATVVMALEHRSNAISVLHDSDSLYGASGAPDLLRMLGEEVGDAGDSEHA